jgi:hypothetical protein
MHGDLCGPVTPATPGGRHYFLLLIDDLSRYMWVVVLGSKGEVADTIRRAQAAAEAECGRKLLEHRQWQRMMGISLCTWSLWGWFFCQHLGLLLEQLGHHLGLLLEQLAQQHLGCFVRTAGQQHLDCF